MKRLSTIALALGEERTRNELIPFVGESNDDDEEVLLAMAEELGSFITYVGGPAYAYSLLPPLEQLCSVEETVVRDKAVESLCSVAAELPDKDIEQHFLPLVKVCLLTCKHGCWGEGVPSGLHLEDLDISVDVTLNGGELSLQRLGTGEWFTSRVSACGLIAIAYKRCGTGHQADLRTLYRDLTHDDTPMVRRAAAQNLGKIAEAMEQEYISRELIPIFHDLTQDGAHNTFLSQRVVNCLELADAG